MVGIAPFLIAFSHRAITTVGSVFSSAYLQRLPFFYRQIASSYRVFVCRSRIAEIVGHYGKPMLIQQLYVCLFLQCVCSLAVFCNVEWSHCKTIVLRRRIVNLLFTATVYPLYTSLPNSKCSV